MLYAFDYIRGHNLLKLIKLHKVLQQTGQFEEPSACSELKTYTTHDFNISFFFVCYVFFSKL